MVEEDYERSRLELEEQRNNADILFSPAISASDDASKQATQTRSHTERLDLAGPAYTVLKRFHPDVRISRKVRHARKKE